MEEQTIKKYIDKCLEEKLKEFVNKYNDDDSKCDNEDESGIWICNDYGTGDSIDISKPSKGHSLRRREMDVMYENIK